MERSHSVDRQRTTSSAISTMADTEALPAVIYGASPHRDAIADGMVMKPDRAPIVAETD